MNKIKKNSETLNINVQNMNQRLRETKEEIKIFKQNTQKDIKDIKENTQNAIKSITYISFTIAIALTLVVSVALSLKVNNLKDIEYLIAMISTIIFSVVLGFTWIIYFIYRLYYKKIKIN